MKDVIKTLLFDWQERKLPDVKPRTVSLSPYLNARVNKIVVVTGFRRVGKTFLLLDLVKQLMSKHSREDVVYINFEDERVPHQTEFLTQLLPTIEETFGKQPKYFFLDEIQNIPNWSKWLRRVYETTDIRFFVTGSNSKMTTIGIPTELRGRFIEKKLQPLSFKEYLSFKGVDYDLKEAAFNTKLNAKLRRNFDAYLLNGGLPEVTLSDESLQQELVQSYYRTVVSRDIVEMHKVRNAEALRLMLRLLINSKEYTISKLFNTLKSSGLEVGKPTLQQYITFAEDAFFLNSLPTFSFSIKKAAYHPRKVYLADNAFIRHLSSASRKDEGRYLENAVANYLWQNALELHYWKSEQNDHEADFVVKDGLEVLHVVQVCADISNFGTLEREIKALVAAQKALRCKKLLLLNHNVEKTEKKTWFGEKVTIAYKPVWKWMLE